MWLKPFHLSDFLRQLKLTARDAKGEKLKDIKFFICHEADRNHTR